MAYRSQPAAHNEYKVAEDQNLLSRTDKNGLITYAAQAFVEVSGYSREELIGAPHSIVRHPDMPREAFANLWETLARGEIWVGLVKNRRKNGDYYWVRAHVAPIVENGEVLGYTSVRVKPTDEEIRSAGQAYARLLAGDSRGIRLDRGRIVRTGWAGWRAGLSLRTLRARLQAAMLANAALFLLALGAVLWRKHALEEGLGRLTLGEAAPLEVVAGILRAQALFDGLQLGVLLLLVLLAAGVSVSTMLTVRREIADSTNFAMQIAAGNLGAARPAPSHNEFGVLAEMLAVMQRSLANIASEVHRSLDSVRPAARQIAMGSEDLSTRTEQQAAALQETAVSMEQITSTVQQNSGNARQASQLANAAVLEVRSSGTAMQQVVQRMAGIAASSDRIAEIIGVIDSIAFQTNILALNASVEAARASEHGRGFAVVASEVRNLATRSASAAEEVRRLIEASRREVMLGEQQVRQAEQAVAGVIAAVARVDDIMGEIASASDEQQRGVGQVGSAVAQLDEATQSNAVLVVESARAAHTMQTQVEALANTISVLRQAGQGREMTQAARAAPALAGERHARARLWEPSAGRARQARPLPLVGEWAEF